jgi:Ca2+-binding EF-hand superfamily protein
MDMNQMMSNNKLKKAFAMFDEDGSGIISADEIKNVLKCGDDPNMHEKIMKIIH